ncbi:integrator complex subunit 8 isoform X2 [Bacillus rossius redtenbacheri]|uniref:integrator complex subunit 8 isoform X2 n=1 Tax=Bacillus rossius redtenbacheri TaxID=93214 RepID=UPI002FDDF935
MEVELLRPGTVPISPDTLLWFEFLLDPALLEKHLSKQNPDPAPTDLIVKFLSIVLDRKDEVKLTEALDSVDTVKIEETAVKPNRKCLALKILSLKVAAHLRWNLTIIESKLPLPMQVALMQALLQVALEREADPAQHPGLDLGTLPGHALFAVALYHTWVLRALMYNRLAARQPRPAFVAIPGLQDPMFVPPSVTDELLLSLEGQAEASLEVLGRVVVSGRPARVPSLDSFVVPREHGPDDCQEWGRCLPVSLAEFHCQLLFDLGRFHFYRAEYGPASEHFRTAVELYRELDPGRLCYCVVSPGELDGYGKACDIVPPAPSENLLYQMHRCIRDQYTVHRDILELDIQGAMSSGKFTVARDLPLQVTTLNAVNRVVTGAVDWSSVSGRRPALPAPRALDALVSALKPVLSVATDAEKQRVKMFLVDLVEYDVYQGLPERVLSTPELRNLFDAEELHTFSKRTAKAPEEDIPQLLLTSDWDIPESLLQENQQLQNGSLEQKLILSYDTDEIEALLKRICPANPMKVQWRINNKWELPIPLQSVVMSLPRGFLQDFVYLLLAKSRELTALKDFDAAQAMLGAVEARAKGAAGVPSGALYKLTKLLGWEGLLIRVTQLLAEWPCPKINRQGVAADCKACLSALKSGEQVLPRVEVSEQCAACLLNLGEWDFLAGLDKRWNYFELTAAVARACADVARHKGSKKACKDAWDLVLPVFGSGGQQKRSSSGAVSLVQRDSPTGFGSAQSRASLLQFLDRLRDAAVLAVVVSLLARLHNVLRDEPALELCVEHVALWPAVVSNANSYHTRGVAEILSQLVQIALKYHPTNISWLKLMGDINFVLGFWAKALQFYLEAGIVASDYFSQPMPRAVVDDHVYRRMIKCCTHLQAHTQAAVLCQFLEDVDYATAFKSLGEMKSSSCSDAMDAYYPCIWDTTILEYLVHLHTKRGEQERRKQVMKVIGLLELNANNNEEIQREAANIRKSRFLRALAMQYVH